MDEHGEVQFQFKEFITDKSWRPASNEMPLQIFRVNSQGKQIVPDVEGTYSIPTLVQPNFYNKLDVDEVLKSVEKCRKIMETEDYGWWLEWLNTEKEPKAPIMWEEMADVWEWPLSKLEKHIELQEVEMTEDNEDTRELIEVTTQPRSLNFLKDALKHTVGYYAVYKPKRGKQLQIGQIINATNEEAELLRFQEKHDATWVQVKTKNKVTRDNVLQLFAKFNNNRKLPTRIRDILNGKEVNVDNE